MTANVVAEKQALEWLARLNSHKISEADEQAFWRWLEASPRNQAAYIKAEKLWQQGVILQRVETKQAPDKHWYGWVGACAAFVLGLVFFFALMPEGRYQQEVFTAIGEQKSLHMQDGSHMLVNTETRVRVEIDKQSRRTYLHQGEVFFNVASDPHSPFDVITPSGTVRVLGTRFAVLVTGQETVVTVEEGSVALGELVNNSFQRETRLSANQRAYRDVSGNASEVQTVDAGTLLAWRKQQLIFRDEPLSTVVAEMQRYWPDKIQLASQQLAAKKVTAVIQLSGEGLDVDHLASALNLRVSAGPGGSLILADMNL